MDYANRRDIVVSTVVGNICFICPHHSWNGVGCIISRCCIGLFVCLFVLSLLVIVRSLRMSVTIN